MALIAIMKKRGAVLNAELNVDTMDGFRIRKRVCRVILTPDLLLRVLL